MEFNFIPQKKKVSDYRIHNRLNFLFYLESGKVRSRREGGKLLSYSTASLGVRGTLRNRVGGGSSEEKKQAEYLAPGRRSNIVHRGVGPGQRSGPSLKEV
uniref:Uncharacterized protein n=1 Tax=Panthera tigris altaica TaxID=74533 RepID=A0A8C9KE76_PANTA